jgi:septum formation protein
VEERAEGAPAELVADNALRKAQAVALTAAAGRLVLGVDTAVFLDGRFYGKAHDADEARDQLGRLSGRSHHVWSAIALVDHERAQVRTACTEVTFRWLDRRILEWYLNTGEWRERAGSYAIQGKGAALVERLDGDYWNVVGLPISLLLDMAPQLLG